MIFVAKLQSHIVSDDAVSSLSILPLLACELDLMSENVNVVRKSESVFENFGRSVEEKFIFKGGF